MKRETIVFLLGFLVVLLPQLGIPENWKVYFLIAAGIILMIVGYSLRRAAYLRSIENESGERQTDSFVESRPTQTDLSEEV